jgi:hypothetical protein
MDFETIAPAPFFSIVCIVSAVYPKIPEANIVGLSKRKPARSTQRGLILKLTSTADNSLRPVQLILSSLADREKRLVKNRSEESSA